MADAVERLMGDLAVFGDDQAMQRSRNVARVLLQAMEIVPPGIVQLTDEERVDVHAALTLPVPGSLIAADRLRGPLVARDCDRRCAGRLVPGVVAALVGQRVDPACC